MCVFLPGLLSWLRQETRMKNMVLLVVFIALFLDHMLLSVVVPILPGYLYEAQILSSGNGSDFPLIGHLPRSVVYTPPHQNPGSNCSETGDQLDTVNIKVGLLLASKSTVQLFMNPFVGPLIDRIGYHLPMCAGFCITVLATILFAFSSSFILMLLARSVQGVGGSCLSVAGMAMLADMYKDEKERGRAMGISFSGLALGLIAGAPFGSLMYQFVGKMSPFLVLAVVSLIFQPSQVQTEKEKGTPLLTLLRDPYILIATGIFNQLVDINMIEAALPIWMMKTMCASKWHLGIDTNICLFLCSKSRKSSYLINIDSYRIICILFLNFQFSKNIYHLLVLNAFIGFSVGIVDSAMMPLMGRLVDIRHQPVYGSVYAIADVAVCIGFCVGPAISGPIVASIGFPWIMAIVGAVNIMFAPLCIFLLNPPRQEEVLVRGRMKTENYKTAGLVKSCV
uniref:Major facilitator superfamily (MFS) profile domain-containing protein n=1 Tax=Labrus bergylta TaxID=56723 RepID=A0A3Q3GQN9_9LABR